MFESFFDGLVLLLGMSLGWALSRRRQSGADASSAGSRQGAASHSSSEPDDAVDALARAADAEPQATGLQLTLGSLFRRRGEIDRAIRIHEAVLARAGLSSDDAASAQIELAQDYLKAGLLDRAEALLLPLSESASQAAPALELLIELQEQSQEWRLAIDTAQRLQAVSGESVGARIAQYHCQLAEAARDAGDHASAARHIRSALAEDSSCVRASLLQGQLAERAEDFPAAVDAYLRAVEQDPRFVLDLVEPLRRSYQALGDARGYERFLDDAESTSPASAALAGARAQWLGETGGDARGHLASQLAQRPTREGLLLWLGAHAELQTETAGLRETLQRSVKMRPRYTCAGCGLQPSLLFWQCPKCRRWGSIGPVEEPL